MLEFFRHRRFANKLRLPWQEGRLSYFAADGDEDKPQDGAEDVESNTAKNVLDAVRSTISSATESFRRRFERAGVLTEDRERLIQTVLQSPAAIRSVLGSVDNNTEGSSILEQSDIKDLMHQVQQRDDEADADFFARRGTTARIAESVAEDESTASALQEILAERLREPERLITLATILERRVARYRELTEQIEQATGTSIGPVSIDAIEKLDQECQGWFNTMREQHPPGTYPREPKETQEDYRLRTTPDPCSFEQWVKHKGIDEICQGLGITKQQDEEKEGLVHRMRNAWDQWRKREHMQRADAPDGEQDATFASVTVQGLEAQTVELKKHIDQHLQLQAKELDDFMVQRNQKLLARFGGSKRKAAEALGFNAFQYDWQMAQERALYAGIRRQLRPEDANEPQNMVAVEDEDYLIHAGQKMQEMSIYQEAKDRTETIAQEQGEEAAQAHFEQNALEDLQQEEKDAVGWMERNVDRMEDAATLLRENNGMRESIAALLASDHAVLKRESGAEFRNVELMLDALEGLPAEMRRIVDGEDTPPGTLQRSDLGILLQPRQRSAIEQLLNVIEDPEYLDGLREKAAAYEAVDVSQMHFDVLEKSLLDMGVKFNTQCPPLEKPPTDKLGVQQHIGRKISTLHFTLTCAKDRPAGAYREHIYRTAVVELESLQRTYKNLYRLQEGVPDSRIKQVDQATIERIHGSPCNACYNSDDTFVYLNKDAPRTSKSEVTAAHEVAHGTIDTVEEELNIAIGHAVVDTVTDINAPELFDQFEKEIDQPAYPDQPLATATRRDLLMSLVDRWGYGSKLELHKKRLAKYTSNEILLFKWAEKRLYKQMREELVVRTADFEREKKDWKDGKRDGENPFTKYAAPEYALFAWQNSDSQKHVEEFPLPPELEAQKGKIEAAIKNAKPRGDGNNTSSQTDLLGEEGDSMANVNLTGDGSGMPPDGGGGDGDGEAGGDDGDELVNTNVRDFNQQIREIKRDITGFKAFMKSYPEHAPAMKGLADEIEQAFKQYIDKPFLDIEPNLTPAQQQPALDLIGERIDMLNNDHISRVKAYIAEIDLHKRDMRNAEKTGKNFWAMWTSINWISVMDVVNTVKQAGEDLGRMWKRRGETAQANLGEWLTGWIPDNQIPGLQYFGRLKKEYNRRSKASEIEEVNQWKEALKDADSYELQDLIKTARNKDQMRAIIELLSERGRLDWNDANLMRSLSAMSSYNMPVEACLRSDVLRDKWYHLVIYDIWDDKDHYYNWRTQNDSNVKSEKGKFTPTADQLSNVPGGLNGELERILRIFVQSREANTSIPQDVNPHLYEEIIDYSIRNGKMTMEDKFYFLVQGIRYKLLSIDRLRTLAGEEGGVLNIFPFIDYFYTKNNTYADIERLGKRLEESKDPKSPKRFKPGLRTTLFVRLEVAREQRVQERLKKGVGKQGENIDHDDIGYFLPELDQSGVKEWLSTLSGNRQKLSKEALKNGYNGFSMKFKTFAALAELDKQGIQKFTQADARNLAQTFGAYVLFDNILTRNGYDNFLQRPELSAHEFRATTVMGRDGVKVGEYREGINVFVDGVIKDYVTDQDWQELDVDKNKFYNQQPGALVKKDQQKLAEKHFLASEQFVTILEKQILKDPSRFMERIRTSNFLSCGVVQRDVGDFTNQDVVDIYKNLQVA